MLHSTADRAQAFVTFGSLKEWADKTGAFNVPKTFSSRFVICDTCFVSLALLLSEEAHIEASSARPKPIYVNTKIQSFAFSDGSMRYLAPSFKFSLPNTPFQPSNVAVVTCVRVFVICLSYGHGRHGPIHRRGAQGRLI